MRPRPSERIVERVGLRLPPEARDWARAQGWPLAVESESQGSAVLEERGESGEGAASIAVVRPDPGAIFRVSRQLPASVQRVPVEVRVSQPDVVRVEVILDGQSVLAALEHAPYRTFWALQPGQHSFSARAVLRDGSSVESVPVQVQVLE